MISLLCFPVDYLERALFYAGTALDAARLIDFIRHLLFALDTRNRADLGADSAALTTFRIDTNLNEFLTYSCRTFLVDYMCIVFGTEVANCAEYRIRSCLSESAKC